MSVSIHNFTTKAIHVAFMDFFSRIYVERLGSAVTTAGENIYVPRKVIQIPVQFASRDKWFNIYHSSSSRKAMDPSIRDEVPVEMQWILPRISVYMNGILYDPSRKLQKTQKVNNFPGDSNSDITRQYTPAPYSIDIEATVITRTLDDQFQIMEQILPFFSPDMSINVKLVPGSVAESVPIVLNGVTTDIPLDYGENDERFITFSYNFYAKTNYYPPKKYQSNLYNLYDCWYYANSNIINVPVTADPNVLIPGTAVFGVGIGPNTFIESYDGSGHLTINTYTSIEQIPATIQLGVNRTILSVRTDLHMDTRYVQIQHDWLEHLQAIQEKFEEYESNASNPNPWIEVNP